MCCPQQRMLNLNLLSQFNFEEILREEICNFRVYICPLTLSVTKVKVVSMTAREGFALSLSLGGTERGIWTWRSNHTSPLEVTDGLQWAFLMTTEWYVFVWTNSIYVLSPMVLTFESKVDGQGFLIKKFTRFIYI